MIEIKRGLDKQIHHPIRVMDFCYYILIKFAAYIRVVFVYKGYAFFIENYKRYTCQNENSALK
jgi:hypothetical protein